MPKAKLEKIVRHCEKILRTETFSDWDGAANGLQVENSGTITKIAAAVDASLATIKLAIAARANLMIVHHGLFWGPTIPWTAKRREMLDLLIRNDLAVYSSHLPLDAHPRLGNNAQLSAALGFTKLKPFFLEKGCYIGWRTRARISRAGLSEKLAVILGRAPLLLPGGRERCEEIGIVTGGAGAELKIAVAEGVDTFITGEGPHWTYAMAEDFGLNVFYGGHYASETFGVKALSAELSKIFRVPWTFLDHPTGL
ncbi:MAG TPA: Nif3-like dinuclear metal center hexameric protein [Verrucomicrobiae bacterium]|jgi:dinuclear metal center YbgI/SA1388 family protein|nr:Nif3-like dinuclear metal center hexameric protein [Verrucomicrobiae bacterium]